MLTKEQYQEIKENEDVLSFLSHTELAFDFYAYKMAQDDISIEEKKEALNFILKNKSRISFESLTELIDESLFFNVFEKLRAEDKVSGLNLISFYKSKEESEKIIMETYEDLSERNSSVYALYFKGNESINNMELLTNENRLKLINLLIDVLKLRKTKEDNEELDRLNVIEFIDVMKEWDQSEKLVKTLGLLDVDFLNDLILENRSFINSFLSILSLKNYNNLTIAKNLLNMVLLDEINRGKELVRVINHVQINQFKICYNYFKRNKCESEFFFSPDILKKNKKKIVIHLYNDIYGLLIKNQKDLLLESGFTILRDSDVSIVTNDHEIVVLDEFVMFKIEKFCKQHNLDKTDFYSFIKSVEFDILDENGIICDDVFEMVLLDKKK